MVSAAGTSEINRLEHLVNDDLDPKWNDPATRGDLRLLAIRIDTKFDGLESRFDKIDARFDKIDTKFDKIDARFDKIDTRFDALEPRFDKMHNDLERAMFRGGRILFGATATLNLGMLAIFATLIK
ncbi:MAG: hypothetical protein ACYC06_03720 [Ilumatobacteraceae bacterium]